MRRLLLACIFIYMQAASVPADDSVKLGIIIDDLGNSLEFGRELIDLPYQLTYSFLPKRPHSHTLAQLAVSRGKEVMVHLPMQSLETQRLGSGALTLELTKKQFQTIVRESIDSVPHAKGVNNHMGSLLTRHPGHMAWLMDTLKSTGDNYYFVDSRTTPLTIAEQIAKEHLVPSVSRDVFIDNLQDRTHIMAQLKRAVKLAKQKGYAVAIGHPHRATLQALEDYLPTLTFQNIEIVPITQILSDKAADWAGDSLADSKLTSQATTYLD